MRWLSWGESLQFAQMMEEKRNIPQFEPFLFAQREEPLHILPGHGPVDAFDDCP